MKETANTKGKPAWFIGAGIFLVLYMIINDFSVTPVALAGSMVTGLYITGALILNGIRSYQGKKTYFWRMIAVYATVLLAVFVLSSL